MDTSTIRTTAKSQAKINFRFLTETTSRYYLLWQMRTLTEGPDSVGYKGSSLTVHIWSGTCEMWRLNQMSYLRWIFDFFSHRFVFDFKLPNLIDSDVASHMRLIHRFDTCEIRCLNWVTVQTSQRPKRPKLIPVACHIQIVQTGLYTFL